MTDFRFNLIYPHPDPKSNLVINWMTELKYLEDTYLFEYSAQVVDIIEGDEHDQVILDSTIFHPQGGAYFFIVLSLLLFISLFVFISVYLSVFISISIYFLSFKGKCLLNRWAA